MKTLNLNFILTIIFSLTVTLGFSSCEKGEFPGQTGPPSEDTDTPGGASNTYCDPQDIFYVDGVSSVTSTPVYTEGRVYLSKVTLFSVSGGAINRHTAYLTPDVADDLNDQVEADRWKDVDLIVTLSERPVTLYSTDEDKLDDYVPYHTIEDTDQSDHSSMWGDEWSKGTRDLVVMDNVHTTFKNEERCTDYIRQQAGS